MANSCQNVDVWKLEAQWDREAERTGYIGAERLNGLIIIWTENGQTQKLNQEQIVQDFVVHTADRTTFRQVSTSTTETSTTTNVA